MRQVGWRTVVGAVLLAGIVHITRDAGRAAARSRPAPSASCARRCPPTRWCSCRRRRPARSCCRSWRADALYAACRYRPDRRLRSPVSAVLADPGWTLSLHTPQGDNFYVMPAQQLRRSEVTFVITPQSERLVDFGSSRRVSGDDSQIESPVTEGLVLVRAPLRGLSWRAETEAKLRRAQLHAGSARSGSGSQVRPRTSAQSG